MKSFFVVLAVFIFCGSNYVSADTRPVGSVDEDCTNQILKFPGETLDENSRAFWCPIDLNNNELRIYVCENLQINSVQERESYLISKQCKLAKFNVQLKRKRK